MLYDYEQAFERSDSKFWPYMLLSLILLNVLSLTFHVFWQSVNLSQNQRLLRNYRFFGRDSDGDYEFLRAPTPESGAYIKPDANNIFSYILGYFVLDNATLKSEMTYIHLLVGIMLLFLGVSSLFYADKSKRVSPVSEKLMESLTRCMDARIDCYTYRAPKMGQSKLPEKCQNYLATFKEFQENYQKELEKKDSPTEQASEGASI